MRGSLHQLYTRLYFSDEPAANQQDALLNAVPEDRRHTLIAHRREQGRLLFYDFDIYMQGDRETVFFDV
jgi:protocatechuate 3,4-dioxygenase alpha subunit